MKRASGFLFLAWVNALFLLNLEASSGGFKQCLVMSIICAVVGILCYCCERFKV